MAGDIVVLHGWSSDHRYAQPIVDELSNHFRVTSLDLPGMGCRAWDPAIKTMHDIADRLLAELPPQAIYVGCSFGGLVSLSIASRYPERVQRFIGVTTTPRFVVDENWIGLPKPGFKPVFAEVQRVGHRAFLQSYIDGEFSSFETKPAMYKQLCKILENGASPDMDVLLKGVDICDATDLRKEFKSLHCPIDLILGEKDGSIPIENLANIKALNKAAKIHTVSDSQHLPYWTHPKEFNIILNKILS